MKSLRPSDLELHEARAFGRFVVHDHPMFLELQRRAAPIVSDAVGEPVEASYSFLSLYSPRGVCAVHLDAPQAKWTFDLCIDQSAPWPIHLSDGPSVAGSGRALRIRRPRWKIGRRRSSAPRPSKFSDVSPRAGQAIVFSGSSQWHYRDPIDPADGSAFCTLLFLHFIPRGTADLARSPPLGGPGGRPRAGRSGAFPGPMSDASSA